MSTALQATTVSGNLSCTNFTGGTLAAAVVLPAGRIIQVRKTVTDTTYSIANSNSWTDAPAYDVSLTPASASNEIMYNLCTQIQCRYASSGGGSGASMRITHNSPGSYTEFTHMVMGVNWNQLNNQQLGANCQKRGIVAAGTTNAINFRAQYIEQHGNTEGWFGGTEGFGFSGTWSIAMEFVPSA